MKNSTGVRRPLRKLGCGFLGIIVGIATLVIFVFRPYSCETPPKIPQGWGKNLVAKYKGQPAQPKPILADPVPKHPFLAKTNSSNMHVDGYASDVHPKGGPIGINPSVESYAHGKFGGECACVTFDERKNILAVCATFKEFALLLMSPDMVPLARMNLPPRRSNKSKNLRKIMGDTSGGAYFFLDNEGRAVLVDADQVFKIIKQNWESEKPELVLEYKFNLQPVLDQHSKKDDVITAVLPDWQGRYWFVSRLGVIGVLDKDKNEVSCMVLENEEIQNSFAVDSNGVYIVSDFALYGLKTDKSSNEPKIVWREEYERASKKKPGTLSLGSGTTPTLLGEKYIAIADNSDAQTSVLVYRRGFDVSENRLICKKPVFPKGRSATENSLIGIGNSLIIENNYGYDLFPNMMFGKTSTGGMARVDFLESEGECKIIWESPIISQTTVPKLSLETGLVYAYTKDPSAGKGIDAYYLTALDFETGEVKYEVLSGTGVSYDNNWAPITIGNDNCVYIGVLRGLVKICDKKK